MRKEREGGKKEGKREEWKGSWKHYPGFKHSVLVLIQLTSSGLGSFGCLEQLAKIQ